MTSQSPKPSCHVVITGNLDSKKRILEGLQGSRLLQYYVRRDKQISSMVALDVLRDGQMRIALGSTRGAEIYLELAMATNSTARMKVVCAHTESWKMKGINIM